MTFKKFDYSEDPGPKDDKHLKCCGCGYETKGNPDIPYRLQSECPNCHYQMMGWNWCGWKDTPERKKRLAEIDRKIEKAKKKAATEKVSQESESFESFTREERNIQGLLTVEKSGQEAPWLTPFGASLVKIYGIRRNKDGEVEFGIGNEQPPILGWVKAEHFYYEWPS